MRKFYRIIAALTALLLACAGCAAPAAPAAPVPAESAPVVESAPAESAESPDVQGSSSDKASETVIFTDSVGREVEIPAKIDKLAITGPLAQITLFALAPEKLVGIASKWDEAAAQFIPAEYAALPYLGQLYGGGELNLETLLASGAQLVVDIGNPKKTIVEDLDALTEQTGLPFVHITAELDSMDAAYTKLGELLNMPDEATRLAEYCKSTYGEVMSIIEGVEKTKLLYVLGENGLNVLAKDSFHAEVVDQLVENAAVVDEPSSRGTGNETDMEQIMAWDPDVVLFAPESIYDTASEDAAWQQVSAIKNGRYYKVPFGPYNWMGFPPAAQRLLGMLWLAKLLYPEQADYDLFEKTSEYFELFYHCELTQEQYDALVADSIGVQAERAPAA